MQVLQLASRMPCLRVFTHVSSTYANIELPLHSTAKEMVYPLYFGDREVRRKERGEGGATGVLLLQCGGEGVPAVLRRQGGEAGRQMWRGQQV